MLKIYSLILFLLPLSCFAQAQYVVKGRVLDSTDKRAIVKASVFLNNAVVGSETDNNGIFILTNVRPGQYDLIVSIIGYETYHQNIMVTADLSLQTILLSPKPILLQEVKIKPNANWAKDFDMFKPMFFGTSAFAGKCKILNPDVLDMDYNSRKRLFTAKSSDFLIIENKALGYRVKYLLTGFRSDGITGIFYYEGSSSFEELKGSRSQQKQWQKNRLIAYEGSDMHFLRSVISNTFEIEGFKVLRLIRKLNPDYTGFGNKYFQTLVNTPLTANDFVKLTDSKGVFALSFNDCLYITYNKKRAHQKVKANSSIMNLPEYLDDPLTTTLIFEATPTFFDNNGIIMNAHSVLFDGNWGNRRIGELLPVDYVPEESGKSESQ